MLLTQITFEEWEDTCKLQKNNCDLTKLRHFFFIYSFLKEEIAVILLNYPKPIHLYKLLPDGNIFGENY